MKTNFNRIIAVIMLVAAFSFSLGTVAQTNDTKARPEERAKNLTDQMQKKLSLTDAQYQSVYNINLKYAKENEQLKNNADSKLVKLKKLKSLQLNKSEELRVVLNKEQFGKYEEWMKDVKNEIKENYRNNAK